MLLLAERADLCWIVEVICQDPALASGGCHRSLQLLELLEKGGFRLTPIQPPPRPGALRLALAGLAAGVRDGFHRPLGTDALRNAGLQASFCRDLFSRYPRARGLIVEGTGYGSLCRTAWCRRHGKRTILVPANLEALASHERVWPYGRQPVLRRLQHELPWYRLADAVVTIAIEEAWILELLGVRSEHLPYYPPIRHRQRLEALAAARRSGPTGSTYLFLADFGNPPNRQAAARLLEWLENHPTAFDRIQVAGRGSDRLFPPIPPHLANRLELLGEVSDAQLLELQRRCRALLILHPPTSGMLTRIIDAAIADLPVVGDWMSFKSYHHCFRDGLLVAPGSSEHHLPQTPPHPAVVQVPAPPHQAEARFLELLSR